MRVLLTTDTVGGVWTFTRELTTGLLKRGHAVALVSAGRAPSREQMDWTFGIMEQYGTSFLYEALEVPLEWMEYNETAYTGAENSILAVAQAFKADIMHASQYCFGALPIEIPKVVTAHSDVLSWAEACRPAGLEESDWLRQYRHLVAAGVAGADILVAPTRWMQEALARNFPASTASLVVLNGRSINLNACNQPRRVQAVTVGRIWDDAKGLTILNEIDAFMPVAIAGEACFEGLPCSTSRKTQNFFGMLNENEVLNLFQESSLYLATSIYEPFGLAPLEAALCGCGVVARDIGSLREVWGDAAMYFTDAKELSKVMSRLSRSSAELQALQSRSMRRAQELSADRMTESYIAHYGDLLNVKSARERAVACVH